METALIGAIILYAGSVVPLHYAKADGKCMNDYQFTELAAALSTIDPETWPYGRCNSYQFKLPDLRDNRNGMWLIRIN